MAKIIFEHLSRDLELLVENANGGAQRGRITLTEIHWQNGDFFLSGIGHVSNQLHNFPLTGVKEIIDLASGEKVNVAEFRTELETHLN